MKQYPVIVSGSGITGDEFVYAFAVLASDHEREVMEFDEARLGAEQRVRDCESAIRELRIKVAGKEAAVVEMKREVAALRAALQTLVDCFAPGQNDYQPTKIFSRTDQAILDARAALQPPSAT